MARYVLSHRQAGITSESKMVAARADADQAFSMLFAESVDLVGMRSPKDETKREVVIFDASPSEVAAKREQLGPDVILEKEILHYPVTTMPVGLTASAQASPPAAAPAGTGQKLQLTVEGPSGPLFGAEVILSLRAPGTEPLELKEHSDEGGKVSFEYGPTWVPAAAVILPAGGHWSMVARGPVDGMTVLAPELPMESWPWWHQVLGIAESDLGKGGKGVTVGVADTGIGPNSDVAHVLSAGAFIDGKHLEEPAAGLDVDSHGTHVCGTIGARPPAGTSRPGGIAQEAEVVCARVFASADSGANQGDIAAAIEHLSAARKADLINLSLGSSQPSEIARDAITDALERGTLTVCAAGNSGGPVEYPAAFPESAAVGALGIEGWGAPGSLSAGRQPSAPDHYGDDNLFLANFSCFGPQLADVTPGVGIIATVPERFGLSAPYGVMDGTSMASPVTCGALAAILAAAPGYLGLPRDATRSGQARALLAAGCKSIGLDAKLEGNGLPQV